LEEPLIPSNCYNLCVAIGQKIDDPAMDLECLKEAVEIIESLPGSIENLY
jgi:hypothetical protein